ncbi:ATP-dependent helicase [candidate division KSB1 bacterium]|nr:ATP-dependent helicase [candidate division KSB1 bacterium]
MTLTQYISGLSNPHETGHGYVGFGHSNRDVETLCQAFQTARIACITINTKQLLQKKPIISGDAAHCIVWQNLSIAELYATLENLLNRVMLPLRLRGIPISFLSLAPREAYNQSITSELLHRDLTRIYNELLLEQLCLLFETDNRPPAKLSETDQNTQTAVLDGDLDDSQRAAIAHRDGPIRVLAPAGSGKTKTLTNRIVHLINEGVKPERILALAFNKKAADEMMQRLHDRGIPVARRMHLPGAVVRTFHGLGYELIRRELGWQFEAETEQDRLRALLGQAVEKHYRAQKRRNQDPLDPFMAAVNICKMDLAPLDGLMVETEDESVPLAPIFQDLLQLQWRKKFCTFDDMIYLALRLLLDRPALRRKMQMRFHYLLIDEFQDLNRAQIMMMQLLALPQNNLFVVGDDDQMIYGWRGADIRHILEFPARYSGSADCTLSTNYRSAQAIVRHSRWLIEHNHKRVHKDISPTKTASTGQLEIRLADSLWQQAREIAEWIKKIHGKKNMPWEDFAVLFRYHAYKYVAAILLDDAGLPHTPVDGRSLAQTPVGRDIMAYLSIILDPENARTEHIARVLKRPNKYFTSHFIHAVDSYQDLEAAAHTMTLPEWMQIALEDFLTDIRFMQQQVQRNPAPVKLVKTLASVFNLREFYRTQKKRYAPLDEAGMDVLLDVLMAVAQAFATIEDFYHYLNKSLSAPVRSESAPGKQQGIILSTIHASKGKEFKHVALFNLSETYRQDDMDDSEEERRVAYVGLTRGSDRVLITALTQSPSPFLYELALNPDTRKYTDNEIRRLSDKLQKEIPHLHRLVLALEEKAHKLYSEYEQVEQSEQTEQSGKKISKLESKIVKMKCEMDSLKKRQSAAEEEFEALERELCFRRLLIRKEK